MNQKSKMVTSALAAVFLASATFALSADAAKPDEAKKTTTENVTVIRDTGAGETVILAKEETATKPAAPAGDVKQPEPQPLKAAPDAHLGKARVAVVPAIFTQDLRKKWGKELSDKFGLTDTEVIENAQYTSYLIDALVNSRKFDVLERENLKSATKELEFGESDYADVARVVKMGQMLNADFVVIPEIRYISFVGEEREVPFVGKTDAKLYLKLATTVRVIDVKTSKIASSNIGDVKLVSRIVKRSGTSALEQVQNLLEGVYKESATRETDVIVKACVP